MGQRNLGRILHLDLTRLQTEREHSWRKLQRRTRSETDGQLQNHKEDAITRFVPLFTVPNTTR
jgi:hypothetical protein